MVVAVDQMPRAIFDWFNAEQAAGTIYAALTGRLYYAGSVPNDVTWPYATFRTVSETPEWVEGLSWEHVRVQFSLFEDSDPECAKVDLLRTKLRKRFDWKTITFNGSEYRTLWFKPVASVGGMPADLSEHRHRTMSTQDYLWWLEEV